MSEQAEDVSPVTLRWAIGLFVAETAAVVAMTGFLVYESVAGAVANQGLATFITWYTAAYAAAFCVTAWGLSRRKRWSRTPALVLNLFLIPIGYYMTQGGLWWLGLPLIGYALVVAWLLIAEPTREALGIH
ncbi:MAG: DUF2127 domain-containing protein [Micromonosporaceae bacterium]|nr:DUF2127 domain-containing protein [Micromonosporaceae bacterium]